MRKGLVKVGRLGKTHGLQGELKVSLEDQYFDEVVELDSLLVNIGGQPIPYFVEAWRSGGNLVKLEEVDSKESAALLQQKDLMVAENQVSAVSEAPEGITPFDSYINWTIEDATIGLIGTINSIVDLPQHYLAEVAHAGKVVMIPLHEDLISTVDDKQQKILMELPEGLLDL
ncbi:MAG: ribosome maturation factor RimM [Bacteroidota bacterium]